MEGCCTITEPCGEDQGDCTTDEECQSDLVCGENNCGNEFTWETANCCTANNGKGITIKKLHNCNKL